MKEYMIKFLPDGKVVIAHEGDSLLVAARAAEIDINSSCGGSGNCDKCLVIPAGSEVPVRACQFYPDRDMTVTVPETSRRSRILQVLNHGLNINTDIEVKPDLRAIKLYLNSPEINDLRSDTKRLINTVSDYLSLEDSEITVSLNLLKQLPIIVRKGIYDNQSINNAFAVIDGNNQVIGLRPLSDTSEICLFGIAIDLGTTTIAAALVNLISGEVLDRASCSNPQISHGDDVISRINYTTEHNNGLEVLHDLAIKAINDLTCEMADKNNVDLMDVFELVVVGNATMQHVLADVPVGQIGQAPYVSGFCQKLTIEAQDCGLTINPCGRMIIAPGVAGHIGGDTIAVALASEMEYNSGVTLAIDIGTNGEIVLAHDGKLLCCSTAAGPAFEGAKIYHGMRAANGAIEKFSYSKKTGFSVATIGDILAIGICGSGLVDIIACLLDNGIIDETGRMLTSEELSDVTGKAFIERMTTFNNQPAFIVVPAEQSGRNEAVILTQRDIRETQLGKAAIAAGVEILLAQAELEINDIDRVYMAGAFGNYLHPASARRVGLFPQIAPEKIISIGNAAGTGAIAMLINHSQRQHSERLANKMKYIELAARAEFQTIFADKMMF